MINFTCKTACNEGNWSEGSVLNGSSTASGDGTKIITLYLYHNVMCKLDSSSPGSYCPNGYYNPSNSDIGSFQCTLDQYCEGFKTLSIYDETDNKILYDVRCVKNGEFASASGTPIKLIKNHKNYLIIGSPTSTVWYHAGFPNKANTKDFIYFDPNNGGCYVPAEFSNNEHTIVEGVYLDRFNFARLNYYRYSDIQKPYIPEQHSVFTNVFKFTLDTQNINKNNFTISVMSKYSYDYS